MMASEKNQNKNLFPLKFTLNNRTYPINYDFEKKEWKDFKDLIFKNIKSRLENIILKLYRWKVPNDLNARVIEIGFLYRGYVCIFKDPDYGFLSLGAVPSYQNIYGQPTVAMAYGFNDYCKNVKIKFNRDIELPSTIDGFSFKKNDRYGVIERDNDYGRAGTPKLYIDYINEYAKILSDIKIGMIVAAQRLKNPFIIAIKKKALGKTVNKVVKAINDNELSVVLIDEQITQEESLKNLIDIIDLKQDAESPKKLAELWENQFDQFLTTIGINSNPSPDKTQYVNNQEIGTNNNVIDIARDVRFDNRKNLCRLAKEVLNLDLKVEMNNDEVLNEIYKIKNYGEENELNKATENTE